jgi:hypothetical protein
MTEEFKGFVCKKCNKKYLTHGYKDDLDICYECHNLICEGITIK